MLRPSARVIPANEADVAGDCSGELVANFDIIVVSQLAVWVRDCAGALKNSRETHCGEGGFEIGYTCLAYLALFWMICVRVNTNGGGFLHWWVFTGLLFGGA